MDICRHLLVLLSRAGREAEKPAHCGRQSSGQVSVYVKIPTRGQSAAGPESHRLVAVRRLDCARVRSNLMPSRGGHDKMRFTREVVISQP
jgi:hypothetical protein